jgi:hypothetical protein
MLPNVVNILPLKQNTLVSSSEKLQSYCSALLAIERVVVVVGGFFFFKS